MQALSVAAMAVVAGLVVTDRASAQDAALGAGCDDAVGRGVWELAIDLCAPEMLPASAPDSTKARVLMGRAKAYQETGDAERAGADAAAAKALDPDSAAAFDAAQAARSKADGDLRQTLKALEAQWRGGNEAQALAELNRTIETHPKSAQAYALRASIYLARRDDRAQADIQSATALARNCALKPRQQVYVFTCPE
jgi:tetratricopeptide (TPR) repeat protein